MTPNNGLIVGMIFAFCLGLAIEPALAGKRHKASAVELALMPQFCWWQYDKRYSSTKRLIKDCGPYMNHHCQGEVAYIRSQDFSRPERERLSALQGALRTFEKTFRDMKGYPKCSIRGHVIRRYAEIRAAFPGFGLPIPPDKIGASFN